VATDVGEGFETRESLHNLFANFRLLRADKSVRLVALTSATQGGGKSTTTFALTLTQLGQRVLLVSHLYGLLLAVGVERINRDLPGQALERMHRTGVDVLGLLAHLHQS
jgi:hypothetical protein